MEVLRIHLKQSSANYKREEIVENKMTYPLPPISTIIGAIHNACGYKEYVPMDISVQGDFKSLSREPYTDHSFLNSTQDDRGILVKLVNAKNLSKGYVRVGKAMKPQGNSFKKNITVMTENEKLMSEYRALKDKKDEIDRYKKDEFSIRMEEIKNSKKSLAEKKKNLDKNSSEYKLVVSREKEIKDLETKMKDDLRKYEDENYSIPISFYKTLTTSLKFYEVLHDIELIVHIKAEKKVIEDIQKHVFDLRSLGRSEDFIEVVESKIVELSEPNTRYYSKYHSFIDASLIDKEISEVFVKDKSKGIEAQGTKYYINKNYYFEDESKKKRIFEKKKVYYISDYEIDSESEGVYVDTNGSEPLIVTFV